MQRLVQDTIAMVPTTVVKDNYDENAAYVKDTGTDIASAANMNRKIAKFQFSAVHIQLTCTDNSASDIYGTLLEKNIVCVISTCHGALKSSN